MIQPKTLKNKKYPAFIRNHYAIRSCDEIEKNFKEVGLADFSLKYKHKSHVNLISFIKEIKYILNIYYDFVYKTYRIADVFSDRDLKKIKLECLKLSKKISPSSIKRKGSLVLPCKIEMPSAYKGRVVVYEKGSPLLGLLNAMCQDIEDLNPGGLVRAYFAGALDDGISLELSWKKSLNVVFSTHPWDIATMSMRGIASCQSWGKPQSTCLIGSIIDPNMGIAYITDGTNYGKSRKYGTRMLARAVVRLVASNYDSGMAKEKEKKLFYERAYGYFSTYYVRSHILDDIIIEAVDGMARKGGYIEPYLNISGYYIPLTPQIKKLAEKYRSYRDSGILYA